MSTFTQYPSSAKWTIGVLLALNIFCLAALWFGRPPGPKHKGNHSHLIRQMEKHLDFDQDQTITFKAMVERHKKEQGSIKGKMRQLRPQMVLAISANPADTVSANAIAQQIGQLTTQREQLAIQHFEEIKNICNPDQALKLQEVLKKAFSKRRE